MSNMTALIIGLAGVAIILKVPRKDIGQARQRISSYSRLGAGAYRSYPESKKHAPFALEQTEASFRRYSRSYAGVNAYRRKQ